jgi:hypothetical protein
VFAGLVWSAAVSGGNVQPFRETAFYLLTWRAFVVALIALVLMVTRSFELAVACLIGADIALLFSLGLIAWNSRLDDERVVWAEACCPTRSNGSQVKRGAVGRGSLWANWHCGSPRPRRWWRLASLRRRS